ncbi:MAG: flagellar biosynthesis protein FlgN [Treponema sp.]|uniref:flagellar biosynthesis protein FlgN n=1 Tax=Treponema sp. TaxID=166 RepID=UPI001B436333|nr:flagellar biosynthesis protein FlgN [Treponema sp.]MBP5588776.1 flagellar biosynthesis protein FlgN [Treponema sp.]MBR0155231.1 flagellar biosynthesis protein FlgN [Treponema sp.]MCR5387413.1 flagellar biosynthesis protein FlgN [Treponema sp.]
MEQITKEELEQRIALLKKFRELLEKQRAKFREYLSVLEKQETSITTENPETLLAHTELEQQVVANIMSLQKVIVPMSELYKERGAHLEEESVNTIQKDLEDLQHKVLIQNQKNRELLKTHIVQIRQQIATLKNPYKTARSVYAEKSTVGVGHLVAVEA